jgi:cytidine deaminase
MFAHQKMINLEPQSITSLTSVQRELLEAADKALKDAYSPYSRISVGAALLLEDARIISGSNFENASYPLCLCAERVALAAVHSLPNRSLVLAMAVSITNPDDLYELASPCGACRQVIDEFQRFQGHPIQLILRANDKEAIVTTIEDLLPMSFKGRF